MNVSILHNDKVIFENICLANTFWERLSGYMFRKKPHKPGILFFTSGSMQTTFMKFNLDLVFLDRENKIIKILRGMKPWRITRIYPKVSKILEVPSGSLPVGISEGDFFKIK